MPWCSRSSRRINGHRPVAAIAAVERDLEVARYEASLAARRYELVDPAKRHVARELEARWNGAPERIAGLERRVAEMRTTATESRG